jgi:myosin-5
VLASLRSEKTRRLMLSFLRYTSGAGKTVSAKFIMRYFATVEDPSRPGSRKNASKENGGMSVTEQQILATNPIMEAFGNAKTTRNDNSSRFGKYIEILFDKTNEIVGARIRTYLLERSRIVFQPAETGGESFKGTEDCSDADCMRLTERNFHIFYQLCAGAPSSERKDLGLQEASAFHYLNQGGNEQIAGVDDAEEFKATQKALSTLGVKIEQQWAIFRLLAALLHLGNVKIGASRNDAVLDKDETNLFVATHMLGIDAVEFKKWTTKRQILMRGEKIVSNLTQAQAIVVRDSVTKYVYSSLFDWLVEQMNQSLALGSAKTRQSMIGVLDIYGFERFKVNSYEQFCINYANERLQHEFNRHVFKLEQEEYLQEKISWTFIDFADNQPTIDMIEGKLGILSLLDEESRLPSGSDASFVQKLYTQIEKKPEYKDSFKRPRFGQSSFTVCHYALDVTYESEGFLEKNRDTVPDEHMALLNATSNSFLKEVFETATRLAQDAKEGVNGTTSTRKPGGVGMARKPTLGYQFRTSLVSLMQTIDSTNVHYIRCIKPNEAKKAWEVEPQNVLGQLRACGVLETIRISCAGYPSRWTFEDFGNRYYLLAHSDKWHMETRDLAQFLLKSMITENDKYQIGLTKIFFRAGMLAHFEQKRTDRLNSLVTIMQKNSRRVHYQRKYQKMRKNSIDIQSWWRMVSARKLVGEMRKAKAATSIQVAVRGWMARMAYKRAIASIVAIQSKARGLKVRSTFVADKKNFAAARLQALLRGALARRQYRHETKGVIHLQSCYRRRLAKKELIARRQEAKSATHYREVTYKLENKVVELTQNLQSRTKQNKELGAKIRALESQVKTWQGKHEEIDARSRGLEQELAKPTVPHADFEALIVAKRAVDAKCEASLKKIADHEARISDLERELREQAEELEARDLALNSAKNVSEEDSGALLALRTEVNSLREQLNRANALNTLSKNSQRIENAAPPTFNMATGKENGMSQSQGKRKPRRHSEVGPWSDGPAGTKDADEEAMFAVKKSAANANRHVSVAAFDQIPGLVSSRSGDYGDEMDPDEQSEEVIRILENEEQLDEDVLNGLIRYLKIPAPSLQNPPSPKEVLFPAHLISLCTNEFWKYGMVRESERFLANVMQTIQQHIMSFTGDDAIIPGFFWLSNVHEIFSFVCIAESDMLQGIGPGVDGSAGEMVFSEYERLVTIVKHDLESLSYNLFHTAISEIKKRLHKMVIPALVESQSLPGFVTSDTGGRLFNRLLSGTNAPAHTMDDILGILNKVSKALKSYYVEPSVTQQVITELLKLIGTTAFNDILMRRNFCSWKRAMQIQYNIMRIDEWCKSHDMPEGMLQLEHLMQATKLLQLKKATLSDIDIIYDVCWMLTPTQIQKLISHYYVADYENPISPEILKAVAARVVPNDRNDHLLLPPEVDEAGPFESPLPRLVTGIETYCPAYISVPALRRLAACVA